MKYLKIIGIVLLVVFLAACSGKQEKSKLDTVTLLPTEKGYSIIFFNLDNYALLYLDDELIVDTREKTMEIREDILIDLEQYLTKNRHHLKIEGYNAACDQCSVNAWDIGYELYLDGEEIDFQSKSSNRTHKEPGKKFTEVYVLGN